MACSPRGHCDATCRRPGAPWGWRPYSGVLLGALVVVAMLMGVCSSGSWVLLRSLRGSKALTGKEGMIGEMGTVRSPVE